MLNNFRIEPISGTEFVKIFKQTNEDLPIEIDCNKRFFAAFPLFQEHLISIHEFEVRKDDVWVITQPKSGTTWMLELVWILKNNLDFETALKVEQEERTPFFECCTVVPQKHPNSLELLDKMSSPRVIKTHLPVHLLPKQLWTVKPKIVFVARDPIDAIVSFYHYHSLTGMFKGTLNEYALSMINEELRYSPFGVQVFEFWQLRNAPYIFFTSFERMKKDLQSVISKLSQFLEVDLNEQEMTMLLDHLSFSKMKVNPNCNHISENKMFQDYFGIDETKKKATFVRKGEIGTNKNELSEEIREKLEKWNVKQMETFGINSKELLLS